MLITYLQKDIPSSVNEVTAKKLTRQTQLHCAKALMNPHIPTPQESYISIVISLEHILPSTATQIINQATNMLNSTAQEGKITKQQN